MGDARHRLRLTALLAAQQDLARGDSPLQPQPSTMNFTESEEDYDQHATDCRKHRTVFGRGAAQPNPRRTPTSCRTATCLLGPRTPPHRPDQQRRGATIRFYQDLLGFPLTELIENRDYPGSSHFFFDIGNGNLLAFFDFPGLDVGPYAEVLGGLHHLAISRGPATVARAGRSGSTTPASSTTIHSEVSVYFRDPDGARIELIADPLGEMYGNQVL